MTGTSEPGFDIIRPKARIHAVEVAQCLGKRGVRAGRCGGEDAA